MKRKLKPLKLNPCPFIKSHTGKYKPRVSLTNHRSVKNFRYAIVKVTYQGYCPACQTHGPSTGRKKYAVIMWNQLRVA